METELDNNSEEEEKFEMSPEQATSLGGDAKPGVLNRKRILLVLCVSFAVIVCGGLLLNTLKPKKKSASAEAQASASGGSSSQFVASLRDSAINRRPAAEAVNVSYQEQREYEEPPELLPPVSFNGYGVESVRSPSGPAQNQYPPPPSQSPPPAQPPGNTPPQQTPTYYRSSLVPAVQGGFYAQNAQTPQAVSAQAQNPADYFSAASRNAPSPAPSYGSYGNQASDYASQNDQQGKQSFSESSNNSGFAGNGYYLGDNALWTGTVIPGILITAINTDLPGNVLARVTQNIYDSQTGRKLLIPQGTILLARYNSSVSYAQNRVQIVWDTIIRPDGFQLDLEGSGGVDRAGMSGQSGTVNENWFEYLKAAGIIALFSIANSKMTETAAAYATEESASNIAASNSDVVNQLGGNIVSRALNIQPTLTVDNGTLINVMLNKTLYLPPVSGSPVTQRYTLE
jgi:type IV secretion system protein VirB10